MSSPNILNIINLNGAQVDRKIVELFEQVTLKEIKLTNFPHELSEGENRQGPRGGMPFPVLARVYPNQKSQH